MNRATLSLVLAAVSLSLPLAAQDAAPDSEATLRVSSRAVLVDVLVTDRSGQPVTGLKRDSFAVSEQGTPQSITFFEEHRGLAPAQAASIVTPQLPPDVFSNFSPIAPPPAVNILLLDALNTPMADQVYLRQAAKKYLKTLRPGSRLAIFTLALRLHIVQGFSDDPATLARALGLQKNDRPDPSVLVQSSEENTSQESVIGLMNRQVGAGPGATTTASPANMIESFQQFLEETRYSQVADREYRTTQALQQLSTYLAAFPGRKNLIWMSGALPLDIFGLTDMRFDDTIRKTVSLLSASRVAVYPVDVRGAWTHNLYQAENSGDTTVSLPQQMIGPATNFAPAGADSSNIVSGQSAVTTTSGGFDHERTSESMANHSSNSGMDRVAEQTGGRAFYNSNDLVGIVDSVVTSSSNFYTLSYTPTDSDMNGAFRKIAINVSGGPYALSYRRGYFASDDGRPGASQSAQRLAIQQANNTGTDPLLPFMDFGLPETDQILYKVRVVPQPPQPDSASAPQPGPAPAALNGPHDHYAVAFAVDLKDLDLRLDTDGLHKGTLNLSLIVYDKYGQVATRRDHVVALTIKPDVWNVFQQTGLQLHDDIDAPRGQYWLRTGVYDQSTHKVGTMEIPLSSVHPLQQASTQQPRPAQP